MGTTMIEVTEGGREGDTPPSAGSATPINGNLPGGTADVLDARSSAAPEVHSASAQVPAALEKPGAGARMIRPALFGYAGIIMLMGFVLKLVLERFDGGDRVVPVFFVALEGLLATGGLAYLTRVFVSELGAHLRAEEDEVRHLGSRGATLADALIRSGDQRSRAVEATQGAASTLANLLIVIGMVGTAWYLLDNASLFSLQEGKIEDTLPHLLAVAPKAFAATGLALSCAALISVVSSFEIRSLERRALGSAELVEAWERGQSERTGEKDDHARLLELLEHLPEQMRAAAGEAGQATANLHSSLKTLHMATGKIAKALESTSATVQDVLQESAKAHRALASASQGAVAVTAQLQQTQQHIAQSTVQSIEAMDRALREYEGRLLTRALDDLPEKAAEAAIKAVEAAVSPAVQKFSGAFEAQSKALIVQVGEANRNSFAQARSRFEEAVSAGSEHMKLIAERVSTLDNAMRSLSVGLADAGTRWPGSAEALAKLDAAMASLNGHASGTGSAVEEALRSLRETTLVLSERARSVGSDARLAGELAGILGADPSRGVRGEQG